MPRKFIPAGITYAKVGGPPDDWVGIQVIDLDTNTLVHQISEVNSEEGWVIKLQDQIPANYETENWPTEKREGNYLIVRTADIGESNVREKTRSGEDQQGK